MMKLHIVMYHYVRDLVNSRYPQIKGLDLNLFEKQIAFLQENFTFVCAEDLLEARLGGKILPENAIFLTFDDGYIDHYTNVFPLLKEKKIPAFFSMPGKILKEGKLLDVNKIHFILASAEKGALRESLFSLMNYYRGTEYTFPKNEVLYNEYAMEGRFDDKDTAFIKKMLQFVLPETLRNKIVDALFREYISLSENAFSKELYMSIEQVRLMKSEGMHFGIHGYDHYWLGEMNKEEMIHDVERALDVFDDVLDRKEWIMCYPYGSYSKETLDFLATTNCAIGLTTKVAVAKISEDNWLTLPRLDTNDYPPKSEKYKKMILT